MREFKATAPVQEKTLKKTQKKIIKKMTVNL